MGLDFLFIQATSSEMITLATSPPEAKNFKKKALLVIKARKEQNEEDFDPSDPFPTGIENEVVFMEITSKILGSLYTSCQVSALSQFYFSPARGNSQ